MFVRSLALFAIVALCTTAQAATVKFSGQWNLLVGGDVLGINNDVFLATLVTDDSTNVLNGQIWHNPATPASTETFLLTGGTVSTTAVPPRTNFNGVAGGGGVINFQIAAQAPTLDQTGLNTLINAGGSAIWAVGGSIYTATIQAVPEPNSALAVGAIVAGVLGYGRRRRS